MDERSASGWIQGQTRLTNVFLTVGPSIRTLDEVGHDRHTPWACVNREFWWRRVDSNHGPTDYETVAPKRHLPFKQ